MRTVRIGGGAELPAIGLGTWRMGERRESRPAEVAALTLGFDLGLTLVDTAEMYGSGGAEEVVGEAIRGRRDQVYVVSKVLPGNASRRGTVKACEASLRRLGTDRIDLYLLHWPGSHPLADTLAAFAELQRAGKVVDYGVSNFDTRDLEAAAALPDGDRIACDQVLYNLRRRGVEWSLGPACRARGIVLMAYTPLASGDLAASAALAAVARTKGASAATVALAWAIREPGVVAIPKAARPEHVREARQALDLGLDPADLAALDREFPPPGGETRLETA